MSAFDRLLLSGAKSSFFQLLLLWKDEALIDWLLVLYIAPSICTPIAPLCECLDSFSAYTPMYSLIR